MMCWSRFRDEEILGGVGRMLISDGRQGARFGRLLSFEHIAIKFHHFFTHCWVVESVLGDQIGGELLLYSMKQETKKHASM